MALHVPLDDLGAAGGAIYLGQRRGRAALALMGLQADPQLELLSAPKALERRAAAALEALLAPPRQRRHWTRREWKLGLLLGAPLLNGQVRESAAQLVQAILGPELAALRRNSGLQPSFVCQVPGKEAQKLKVVPAEKVAAGLWVHHSPEAVPHARPRAAGGEAHLQEGGTADLEHIQDHVAGVWWVEPRRAAGLSSQRKRVSYEGMAGIRSFASESLLPANPDLLHPTRIYCIQPGFIASNPDYKVAEFKLGAG